MLGYLKRRFSSGDLQGEAADQREQEGLPSFLNPFGSNPQTSPKSGPSAPGATTNTARMNQRPTSTEPTYSSISAKPKTVYPSAPTSPTKSSSGFSAAPMVESITGQISSTISRGIFGTTSKPTYPKGKCKTLLIIDEPHTDWSKYFRGRKIFGDWDLRVEQAQFNEINMVAYSDYGCTIDVQFDKSGTKTMRSFKPDFVAVRQSTNDAGENWNNVIMGLLYSGVPGLNSLHAIFNMHERPWMYSHLELVRNRLGKENFPLIEQAYYPSHKEMVVPTKFPMVIKIGNCRGGKGKIKVDNHFDFQDIASIVAVANTYATSEPFIDAKCDVVIQKIGNQFKAFQRKSLSGSWKTNTGSAILEQVPMNEKFKLWIAEVAKLFGGLDMCSLKVLQSKTDEYFIYELKGSNMNLLGETQEEDRKLISELIMSKIQIFCRPNIPKAESLQAMNRQMDAPASSVSMTPVSAGQFAPSTQSANKYPVAPQSSASTTHDFTHMSSISSSINSTVTMSSNAGSGRGQNYVDNLLKGNIGSTISSTQHQPPMNSYGPTSTTGVMDSQRPPDSQMNSVSGMSSSSAGYSNANMGMTSTAGKIVPPPSRPFVPPRQTSLKSNSSVDDTDDTMKNLRKTFAGIFGDM